MSTLGELGEKEAVRRIISSLPSQAAVGPGDDAAAVSLGDSYLVVSTDLISRGGHMPGPMSYEQMGWMAAAVNYSDVAAMGAKPLGMVASFGLPRNLDYHSLEEMTKGMAECSRQVGAEVRGGDTKEAAELIIAGTAFGLVRKEEILLRRGASRGDLLAVTGTIGLAAAGYYSIKNGFDAPQAIKALLQPMPRVEEGTILSSSMTATSCMDISDGLAYSVHELSKASGVSFELDWSSVPVEAEVFEVARDLNLSLHDLVLYYGGDYELLFTFKASEIGRLTSLMGSKFTVIGRVRDEPGGNVLIKCGQMVPLENRGWEHFRR